MRLRHTVFVLAMALAITVFTFSLMVYFKRKRFESNYDNLQVGDSKQKIVELLGPPNEVVKCSEGRGRSSEVPCTEEYWYRSVFERRILYINNTGQIIDKSYSVLP